MNTQSQTPQDFTARARISFTVTAEAWHLTHGDSRVSISRRDYRLGFNRWQWQTDPTGEIQIQSDSGQRSLRLVNAGNVHAEFEEFGALGGVALDFTDFPEAPELTVNLFIALNWQSGECAIEIRARDSDHCRLVEVRYPGSVVSHQVRNSVIPFMQGILLPCHDPHPVKLYTEELQDDTALFFGRTTYMPWYGVENHDGGALLVTVDTPDDAGIVLRHPAGGPTWLETRFVATLGRFGYTRKMRLQDFATGNYVTLAHAYRDCAARQGKLVKLTEKEARTPGLERLTGAGVLHGGVLYHYREGTFYHNPDDPAANYQLKSYDFYIAQLETLKRRGLQRLYFHLDGWGYGGYDAYEPDPLPVGDAAGGLEGLLRLNHCCHRLGYQLALHQQYRDNYLDAASYTPAHLMVRSDGSHNIETIWAGGTGATLCAHFSVEYVKRNNRYFQNAGLQLDGSYLDVFSVVPPDECFHPRHRMTRGECLKLRGECFSWIKHFWGITSSEEPTDWSVPYLDIVHHAPWPRGINPEKGDAVGLPIPLFNLVYHDCLIIPWNIDLADSGWGFPPGTVPFLAALLNGGVPYVPFDPTPEELERVNLLCTLHRHVAHAAMTNHEFLNESGSRQRSTFANGVTVTVDHATRSWQLDGMAATPKDAPSYP